MKKREVYVDFSVFLSSLRRVRQFIPLSPSLPLLVFFLPLYCYCRTCPPSFHAPFPPSSRCLSLPHPSLPSLSLQCSSDYHSTHRVRPDSQILLSTILHHLLLVGATEGGKLRQSKRDDVGGVGGGLQNQRDAGGKRQKSE